MDIELILNKLAQAKLIRLNRPMNEWYSIYCPFHTGGNENRPSFGVLMQTKYYDGIKKYPEGFCHCFQCSYAKQLPDMVTDLLKINSIDSTGIEWLKSNVPGFNVDYDEETGFESLLPQNLIEKVSNKYAMSYKSNMQTKTTYVDESELAKYRYTVPYMYQRKMTDEVIALYDIGFQADWIPSGRKNSVPCITIPVRDTQGRTLFFCRRSIEGKIYNYPKDVVKPIFGLDVIPNNCRSLIICEGAINAITAHIFGYQAVALLGTGTSYQMEQLKKLNLSEVTLCLDGDEAGIKGAAKLKSALSKYFFVWTITMPPGKDVNDCTKEEFDFLYKNRK